MINVGKYITKDGFHVTITATTSTKAYGKISGKKTFDEWTIKGVHQDPKKNIERKA